MALTWALVVVVYIVNGTLDVVGICWIAQRIWRWMRNPSSQRSLLSSSFDYIIVFVSVIRKSSIIKIFCGYHHGILRLFTATLFPTSHWQLTLFLWSFSLTHTYTLMQCNKNYLLCANSYMEIWLLADQVYLLLPICICMAVLESVQFKIFN